MGAGAVRAADRREGLPEKGTGVRQSGFTLIEVIVALAILVGLGSLVIPAVWSRLSDASGEAVAREIEVAVGLARGEAIRAAEPIRLVLISEPSGEVRLVGRRLEREAAPALAPDRFVGPVFDVPDAVDEGGSPGEDRLLAALPRGVRISREPPVTEGWGEVGVGGSVGGGVGDLGFAEGLDPGLLGSEGVTVGVLLPTGGAVPGAPVHLWRAGGWSLVLVLDPWTGRAHASAWTPPVVDELAPPMAGPGTSR